MAMKNTPISAPVTIESLDHEGRGIAHVDGKVLFIEGALPYETVRYRSYRQKPSYEQAQVHDIVRESFMRVKPRCPHFGMCGGCNMQHLEINAQLAVKQRILEDNLWHLGRVKAEQMLAPIVGNAWGYRQRARLSVRFVEKKGGVLVGFHERKSSFIADMQQCSILPPAMSALLLPLRALIGQLSIKDRLPQVEFAGGDAVNVLVLRVMESLTTEDESLLKTFADTHAVQFWLQPKGPDSAYPFYPLDAAPLRYTVPEFDLSMPFRPTEFTQVNADINRVLLHRAMQLLDPQPHERIMDLFCGLGNFSLPIARSGAYVIGVEGSPALVQRARENAQHNNLEAHSEFHDRDLFQIQDDFFAQWGNVDKLLIDPPRDGAVEIVKALHDPKPKRIVYVSCNPATLARDAAVLVNTQGYVLKAAGVINMFPHTAHVESIAWFEQPI